MSTKDGQQRPGDYPREGLHSIPRVQPAGRTKHPRKGRSAWSRAAQSSRPLPRCTWYVRHVGQERSPIKLLRQVRGGKQVTRRSPSIKQSPGRPSS
eukprot:361412-Chlamydomonas_euryale.AAC.6